MKKLSSLVDRSYSILTGKGNLEPLLALKDFPVFFGCVETPATDDLVADMDWRIDPETGIIQLAKLIPLDVLYQEQHVDGCGPTWQRYYADFAEYLAGQHAKHILEIGGGQGALAEIAVKNDPSLSWTILEPNPTHPGGDRISIVRGFLDEHFTYEGDVDAVVFSQVMEHAYDPRSFLGAIAKFLPAGKRLIFAYPNLAVWLERSYTNALNFEHTMFLTDYFVDYLLAEQGFRLLDKRAYKDHSHFYTVERVEQFGVPALPPSKYEEYKKVFKGFVDYHKEMISDLNTKAAVAQDPTYLFGAHIFATFLFAFGLKKEKLVAILDNSPTKQGKRLYGTDFIVASPKTLAGKGKVNVILKAGIYNEEIKKDILENINPDVVFW